MTIDQLLILKGYLDQFSLFMEASFQLFSLFLGLCCAVIFAIAWGNK